MESPFWMRFLSRFYHFFAFQALIGTFYCFLH